MYKMLEVENEGPSSSKNMFGPLSFEEITLENYKPTTEVECFLCDLKFSCKEELHLFLKHIFNDHSLIVEDIQNIERIEQYVSFWKKLFLETPIESIIPSVRIEGTSQYYFVLSDLLKDDKHIRHKIKLECALERQEIERTKSDFTRLCIFCKLNFEGTCLDYVKHLSAQHNLQLGKPENLVYIRELLDAIEDKINNLRCLYCEKTFTDRNVLKEHMRKKLHKRINPSNHFYDKFYIVNYLESDKNWQHLQREDDNLPVNLENDSDQEWSDWNEKDQEIVCLFCTYKNLNITDIFDHIKYTHMFDFQDILNSLDFYQRVKLVNYIRRQMHLLRCIKCDANFESKQLLDDHLKLEKHNCIPEMKIFDQPEYYFPTYENDTLLYYLEEINEGDSPQ